MKSIFFILCLAFLYQAHVFGQSLADSVVDGAYIKEWNLINGKYLSRMAEPVTVKLVNATGHDIRDVIFYNVYFPILEKDSATSFFQVPNYMPSDIVSGKIQAVKIDNGHWIWHCKGVPYNNENKTLILEIVLEESEFVSAAFRLNTRISAVVE